MRPCASDLKPWQAVLAVVGVIAVMFFAWRILSPVPKFTSAEQAQFEFATADLEAFLPALDDLSPLPWEFYDCTEEHLGVVGYDYDIDYDLDGSGGDLTGIDVKEDTSSRHYVERTFCYEETDGRAVSVVIAVPDDKVTLNHWRQAHTDLAEQTNEGLRIATDAFMQRRDAELLESRWLSDGSDLGDKGYGVYYGLGYPGYEVGYYDYDFMRGLVNVSVLFILNESTDLSDETDAIMAGIDEAVKQRLQVLSASGDGPPPETQN